MSEKKHARMWLSLDKIDREGSIQTRAATDMETVIAYADAMRDGETFPPVTVYRDGSRYYLADGWHRLLAVESLGKDKIEVEIVIGTQRDALLHAIGANANHGRQRTMADKEKAVLCILGDEQWSKLSDVEICRMARITNKNFIKTVREKFGIKASDVRMVSYNGRMHLRNVSNTGRSAEQYDAKLAGLKFNRRLSHALNKAMDQIDKLLIAKSKVHSATLFEIRKKLTTAVADIENRLLAKKIREKKK